MKKIIICSVFVFLIGALQAQVQKGTLIKGKTIQSEMKVGDKHIYKVHMEKDQFVLIKVNQIDIDLKISTYNPKNKLLEKFDGPAVGDEFVSIKSRKKGDYVVEVSPFNESAASGNYEIVLDVVKSKAHTPEGKLDELFIPWNSDKTPGAAMAVIKDGKIICQKTYGMANLEYDVSITPSSIFNIASLSKQFTAFAILLLEKEGKLNIDTPIKTYIPEFPDFDKQITIRHLLTHTSGLRDHYMLMEMSGMIDEDYNDNEQVLKLICNQKELNFNPGDNFSYCNSGYVLLTEIVERITGQPFAQYAQAHIFEPLNMTNSFFPQNHEAIIKNRVESYVKDSQTYAKKVSASITHGDGSLYTNIEDLYRWVMNFSNPIVGDASIFNRMNSNDTLNSGQSISGGYGQFVGAYRGIKEVQHGGYSLGYRTQIIRYPDQNLAIIFLGNAGEFDAEEIAHDISDIFLEEYFKKDIEDLAPAKDENMYQVNTEILKKYEGDYVLSPTYTVTLTRSNNMLLWESEAHTFYLAPVSDTRFTVPGVVTIDFKSDSAGNTKAFRFDNGADTLTAPKIIFDKNNIAYSDYKGFYSSDELATTYHFDLVDNKLIGKHRRIDIAFNPIRKDEFAGLGRYEWLTIKFIRNNEGEVTGCHFSGSRASNVYFERKQTTANP